MIRNEYGESIPSPDLIDTIALGVYRILKSSGISCEYCKDWVVKQCADGWTIDAFRDVLILLEGIELGQSSHRDDNIPNIVDVKTLVPNKVVEVIFADGTQTKSVCLEPDVFSLETAISICLAKKAMGGSSTYHKAIRNGVKVYEDKLKKEAGDKAEKERIERKRAKRKADREKRAAKREQADREKQIAIQKEAYIQAIESIKIKDLVSESVEKYSGILKNMGKSLQDQMKFCEENNNYKCGVYVRNSAYKDYVIEAIKLLLPPSSQAEITNNQNGVFIKYPNGSLIRIISANGDIRGYRFNGAIIDYGIGRENIDTIISSSLAQLKTENDIYDCTDNPRDRVYYCG